MTGRNEETITFDEALSFVAGHCDWNPVPSEHKAARDLIEAGIAGEDLDALNEPGNAGLQDRIDSILYPEGRKEQ